MGRRKRKKSGLEQILALSWKEQVVLAVIAAGTALLIPLFVGPSPLLFPLSRLFSTFASIAAVALLVLAAIKFAIERRNAPPNSALTDRLEPVTSTAALRTNDESRPVGTGDEGACGGMSQHRPADLMAKPERWSLDLLRELEWKRFEVLCGAYYEKRGFRVETIACGADGGIDAKLYFAQIKEPVGLVQCKAWSNKLVGVKPVRELLGVMVHNKVAKGILHATGTFSSEAVEFAGANKIQLIGGAELVANIEKLAADMQKELLALATQGDYKTPTCPSCGIKMKRVSGKRGDFWGCTNYPRCRVKWSTAQLPE